MKKNMLVILLVVLVACACTATPTQLTSFEIPSFNDEPYGPRQTISFAGEGTQESLVEFVNDTTHQVLQVETEWQSGQMIRAEVEFIKVLETYYPELTIFTSENWDLHVLVEEFAITKEVTVFQVDEIWVGGKLVAIQVFWMEAI